MATAKKKQKGDNGAPGIQPSVRVFTTWTSALIRSAEISADGGNLRQAANLTEWILTDDRVQGTLGARVDALLGLDPTFEASGDKRRSKRAVKALEAGEDWFDSYPESEVGLILRWGIMLGLAPARHSWEILEGHDGRVLPLPEFWHPQHVRFDWPTRRWMTWIQGSASSAGPSQEIEFVPGDGDWILHRPYGKNRPWAWGLWRALADLVLLKHLAEWDFSRAGEKGALLVGETGEAFSSEDGKPAHQIRQELAQSLYQRGRDGVCILPAGISLKMLQLAASTPELYAKQIEMANLAITINIRRGNLTTEVQSGSLAATEAQERSGDLPTLRADAQAWTTTVHDQSLKPYAERNWGDRNLAPYPVYPVEPKKNLKVAADTANGVLDAAKKASDLGFKIKRKEFTEEFELDGWLDPGEDLPRPVPDAPTPGAPAPAGATGAPAPLPSAPPARPAPEARAGRIRLASGDSARKGRGFLEGQLYADALTERGAEAAREALEPTIDAVLEELDAAKDYDDLRERLRARYEKLEPEEISDLVYAVMALGELAGRTSVNQDA